MIEVVTTNANPTNKAQLIREYVAANPTVAAKDVANNLGVNLQYVYTVMYKVKAKTKVKKHRKVTKKLGRPRKVTEASENLKRLVDEYKQAKATKKDGDWRNLALASTGIPFYEDSVTHTTPKRMAELAYEAGMGKAQVDKYWKAVGEVQKAALSPERIAELSAQAAKPKLRIQGTQADPVNHPAHYKVGGIETIDFIEAKKLGYNLGNVVKYITRSDHKGNRKQDLEKALWYLNRELSTMS